MRKPRLIARVFVIKQIVDLIPSRRRTRAVLRERYGGDLRKLREEAERDAKAERRASQAVQGAR